MSKARDACVECNASLACIAGVANSLVGQCIECKRLVMTIWIGPGREVVVPENCPEEWINPDDWESYKCQTCEPYVSHVLPV